MARSNSGRVSAAARADIRDDQHIRSLQHSCRPGGMPTRIHRKGTQPPEASIAWQTKRTYLLHQPTERRPPCPCRLASRRISRHPSYCRRKHTLQGRIRLRQWPLPTWDSYTSLRLDPRRLDHFRPALDLLRDELRQVLRAAALRRHDLQAQVLEAFAHRGVVEHVVHRLCHFLHDRWRRSLREEERVPHARLDARES